VNPVLGRAILARIGVLCFCITRGDCAPPGKQGITRRVDLVTAEFTRTARALDV